MQIASVSKPTYFTTAPFAVKTTASNALIRTRAFFAKFKINVLEKDLAFVKYEWQCNRDHGVFDPRINEKEQTVLMLLAKARAIVAKANLLEQ